MPVRSKAFAVPAQPPVDGYLLRVGWSASTLAMVMTAATLVTAIKMIATCSSCFGKPGNGGDTAAAEIERLLASTTISDVVHRKITKIKAETEPINQQWAYFVANGSLPPEQAAELAEELLDAIGVLYCSVADLKRRKIATIAASPTTKWGDTEAVATVNEALKRDTESLRVALLKFREWGLTLPTSLAAAATAALAELPIAATDPKAKAIHAARAVDSIPGKPSLQQAIGAMAVAADVAEDGGPEQLALTARLADELIPLYADRRATATEMIVPAILEDVDVYDAEVKLRLGDAGAREAIAEIDAASRARVPQSVEMGGSTKSATEDVADALAIGEDIEAPDPFNPGFALYIRKAGIQGSILLYLLVSTVAAAADCGAEVIPGGLKGMAWGGGTRVCIAPTAPPLCHWLCASIRTHSADVPHAHIPSASPIVKPESLY